MSQDPSSLVPSGPSDSLELAGDVAGAKVARLLEEGTPANTRRAYAGDLAYFAGWLKLARGKELSFPVALEDLVDFVADHLDGPDPELEEALAAAGLKRKPGPHAPSTVRRRVAAISAAHSAQGIPDAKNPARDPRLRMLLSKGARAARKRGFRTKKAAPITRSILYDLVGTCAEDLAGRRDAALLFFAFASGGRRRSEIGKIQVGDLQPHDLGYVVAIGATKTDPEAQDDLRPVFGRAAEALSAWLEISGLEEGALFRSVDRHGHLGPDRGLSGAAVQEIVRRRAKAAGFDEKAFSGHSLRSGFITQAGEDGVPPGDAMYLSGHKSLTTFTGYYRVGSLRNNRGALLGG